MGDLAVQSVSDSSYIDLFGECLDVDQGMDEGRRVDFDVYNNVEPELSTSGCVSPSWRPLHNCGFAEDAPLPEKYFTPWIFRHTDTEFFTTLDAKLSSLSTVAEKAQAIVAAASALSWRFQSQPTGKSPDQLFRQPQGNCTDVTNFLYSLFIHYGISSAPVYVERTRSDRPDHVALVVKDQDKKYFVDLTLKPNAWDVSYSDPTELTDREFAALYFNGMGVGWNAQGVVASAKTYFDVSHELCPDLGSPIVNGAKLAMKDQNPDLKKARALLDAAQQIGYASAEDYSAEMQYASLIGDAEAYSQYSADLKAVCPTHPELEMSFYTELLP